MASDGSKQIGVVLLARPCCRLPPWAAGLCQTTQNTTVSNKNHHQVHIIVAYPSWGEIPGTLSVCKDASEAGCLPSQNSTAQIGNLLVREIELHIWSCLYRMSIASRNIRGHKQLLRNICSRNAATSVDAPLAQSK